MRLLPVAALALLSSAAIAQTIEPPLPALIDGHYWQVQIAVSPWTTVCEDEALDGAIIGCTVPDGTYNAINHTTGERFEGIVVSGFDNQPPPVNVMPFYHVKQNCSAMPDGMFGGGNCFLSCETGDMAISLTCAATEDFEGAIKPVNTDLSPENGTCSIDYWDVAQIRATLTCARIH
ncbi:hypothetical protein [uncultured Paraglaciecola sp.]|uniref:hypothetical protein n=1 Tax=uncultured Paraglaciecola sp. TaxID=1765024 RepID=UPI00260AC1F7|nr:hypothetical protein [uncultured Paraglaciecola sp.]